jgi:urease accessory protein UreE
VIHCATANIMARCAFHLGNRHTQVQIGEGFLRIRVDAVLRTMVEGLGARVELQTAAFEPEAGAYSGGGHSHGGEGHLLAPVPLRQKIHRPGDAAGA